MDEGFDVAQICLDGHVVNESTRHFPDHSTAYCQKCGEPTITDCPACKAPIRGALWGHMARYRRPNNCHACGAVFPWVERRIQAAIELVTEAGGVAGDDADKFKDAVQAIAKDSSRSELGAVRMKNYLGKVGNGVAESLRNLLVDITAESVKRTIWGDVAKR